MDTIKIDACPCADDRAADDWAAIEARFQRAKNALLDMQQRHGDAAREFLLARAQVRQVLETVFPGAEADSGPPISEARCGCDGVAAQQCRCDASCAAS